MAAGDISFVRGSSTCSCAKILSQASLRFWVGVRLMQQTANTTPNLSMPLLYFLNYGLQITEAIIPAGGGNPTGFGWYAADSAWQFSIEPEDYGSFVTTGSIPVSAGFRNSFTYPGLWNDPAIALAQVTQGAGSYVFRGTIEDSRIGPSLPFALQSFTPGDAYSITLIDDINYYFPTNTRYTVTRKFSDWLSPERMSALLTDDLQLKRLDVEVIPRAPVRIGGNNVMSINQINGAYSDRATNTLYVPGNRALFLEAFDTDYHADSFLGSPGNLVTHFGHAARRLSTLPDTQSFFMGGSEFIAHPAYLMRSEILVHGRHRVETQDDYGYHLDASDPHILDCENVEMTCPALALAVEPPAENDWVKTIWLDRACGDPNRARNFLIG